jgi:cell division septal protein FtsQ
MLDERPDSMEQGMEAQLTESTGEHRRHRRRHRPGHSRRKQLKKVALRLGIIGFILLVILAIVYVWVSSSESPLSRKIYQHSTISTRAL